MRCPYCGGRTRVVDTQELSRRNETRRRHECLSCGERSTSYEKFRDARSRAR